jgi:hypothetical protein
MRAQARLTTISTWLGGNVMIPRWDMRMAIKNRRLQGYRFNRGGVFFPITCAGLGSRHGGVGSALGASRSAEDPSRW